MTFFSSKKSSDKKPKITEGEDYYIENGLYVFTETYHKKRGYCCGSGCRHCPFPKSEIQDPDSAQ